LKIVTFPKNKQIHFIRNYLAKRSSIWHEESNKNLQSAVNQTNESHPMKLDSGDAINRAFFVKVPFEKENAYGAEKTFLWKLINKTKTNDPLYEDRAKICKDRNLEGFNRLDRFICHRAGLFHPNVEGANAYFNAIKSELERVFKTIN
jgi:hypothetical protein